MTALTVLCSAAPRSGGGVRKPGGALPYGMAELGRRFDLRWPTPRQDALSRRVDGAIRRLSPGRRGWQLARAAGRPRSGAVLSVFEDAGLAYARRRERGPAHVMVACWLAQDVADRPSAVGSWRTSLRSVDAVCVYSANQQDILAGALGVPSDRIRVVPFGVDTDYYDPAAATGARGGGGVVAVGSDSRRDYATLFAVAERTGIPMTVACHPRNVTGMPVPAGVRMVSVFDADYRDLLHRADVVVTPTTAPAYPSGQSVVLEAMSMGTATVTTDSAAMRDYVDDGVTGLLVPAHDADALAGRLEHVLRDDALRRQLGQAGARAVRARFGLARQWDAVATVIEQVAT